MSNLSGFMLQVQNNSEVVHDISVYGAPAHVLTLIIAIFGTAGNFIMLYILNTSPQFKHKSFSFLANVSFADGTCCLGFIGISSIRLVSLFRTDYNYYSLYCLAVESVAAFGGYASATTDLIVAVDRLIFLSIPMIHIYKFQRGYVWTLICIGWIPSVTSILSWYPHQQPLLPILFCTGNFPPIYTPAVGVTDKVATAQIIITLLLYPLCVIVAKRTLRFSPSLRPRRPNSRRATFIISSSSDPRVQRNIRAQQRLFRVAVTLAVPLLFTNLVAFMVFLLIQIVDSDPLILLVIASYAELLTVVNSADTILLTYWRDLRFRVELKKMFGVKQ